MEEAIRNRDFTSFAQLTCADSNQFHAVCLDTSPPIFYMNDTSHRQNPTVHNFVHWAAKWKSLNSLLTKLLCFRIISLVEKWNRSEGTPQVWTVLLIFRIISLFIFSDFCSSPNFIYIPIIIFKKFQDCMFFCDVNIVMSIKEKETFSHECASS